MRICGVKLTHDAAVAVIEDGRLLFSVEVEKLNNNPRYSKMDDVETIATILRSEGVDPDSVDRFALDGWKHGHINGHNLDVASYHEHDSPGHASVHLTLDGRKRDFASYTHNLTHVLAAYCAAPFAGEPAYVLVWDGGQGPRLYVVDPSGAVSFVTQLFDLYGIVYGIMGYYFGPYADPRVRDETEAAFPEFFGGYETPGKLMAWIGFGKVNDELLRRAAFAYSAIGGRHGAGCRLSYQQDGRLEHAFLRAIKLAAELLGVNDADALATIHHFLGSMLTMGVRMNVPEGANLCFTGGSALNIKWNSMIRESRPSSRFFVPPFPNDCGNAIGAACAEMVTLGRKPTLSWSVYSGPRLRPSTPPTGWETAPCDLHSLAALLHSTGAPVVFLNGRAELGPRALGARSIFASATVASNRDVLNGIKLREAFRPVAPICLESAAPRFFSPGTSDPFMLFDHRTTALCRSEAPAVVHLDGTARLQTVNAHEVAELLQHYAAKSGVPLLCNTSANLNGSGFFPDARSAMLWGGTRFVWAEGTLYFKERSEQ